MEGQITLRRNQKGNKAVLFYGETKIARMFQAPIGDLRQRSGLMGQQNYKSVLELVDCGEANAALAIATFQHQVALGLLPFVKEEDV